MSETKKKVLEHQRLRKECGWCYTSSERAFIDWLESAVLSLCDEVEKLQSLSKISTQRNHNVKKKSE